jgi:hypothetical protein
LAFPSCGVHADCGSARVPRFECLL